MVITLLGEPKSTGNIYKSRVIGKFASVYMTNGGKALKEYYQWQAKSQWKNKVLDCDLAIGVKLYFGTKRRSDIDNFNKLLLDSLTGIVYKDDSQIQHIEITKFYDKELPRIEITIVPYEKEI